jgi:ACS family pantothenate transporter-like MFS transporter
MFSGFLQGGIYTTLSESLHGSLFSSCILMTRPDGKKGLSGWRWLFVIDFLITLPIAAYGYFCFPDTPSSSTARYLSAEERALAISRLPAVTSQRGVLGWKRMLRVVLGSWQWWGFSFVWCVASNTEMFSTNAIMNLWLASTGNYTTAQVNYIPTAVSGMGILATLVLGWYTDLVRRSYWHVGIFLSFTATISGAIMLNPPTRGAKFFALILNGCQYASQTTMFAWANHLCRHDDAKRTVVLSSMNMFAIAVYMFWSLVFYNVSQAPIWFAGSIAMICMAVALFLTTIAIHLLEKKQLKTERLTGLVPPDEASAIEQAIDAETKLG